MAPPSSAGNVVTILSLDGGGIRGLIPAVILRRLEAELQGLAKDENVRLADFFDVIAGSSTGGLISAMLTTPDNEDNNNNRPFSAAKIVDFYKDHAAEIFSNANVKEESNDHIASESNDVEGGKERQNNSGPKYDGLNLQRLIREKLKETRVHDTSKFANVVIPCFDMKKLTPVIFSTYKVGEVPQFDAKLSDICIATSAAPTYFPPHYFLGDDQLREFHLTDGGVAALNPAMGAISEVAQQKIKKPEWFPKMESPNDYKRVILISLGCGVAKERNEYDAREAANWGALKWIVQRKSIWPLEYITPIVEMMYDGNADMIDYHLVSLFYGTNALPNYLRVQDDNLIGRMTEMDNADPTNLAALEKFGEDLLDKYVKRVNMHTFELEDKPEEGTYLANLQRLAHLLFNERQARLQASLQ